MREEIHRLWEANRDGLDGEMRQKLAHGDVYVLYDVQIFTNNLLRYACVTGDDGLLDGLCGLYLIACDALTRDGEGIRWVYADPANFELNSLLNQEIPLITSQFLCAAAEGIHGVAGLAAERRTPAMMRFVREYLPVISDFYTRRHDEFHGKMQRSYEKTYPPADDALFDWGMPVFDDHLFFLGGMAHLLLAHSASQELALLGEAQLAQYRAFIALGSALIEKRLTPCARRDFEGNAVEGLNFDLGVWDKYEDYAYTAYAGESYPTQADKRAAHGVGWDISHARRFVNAFDALHDARHVTGLSFPDGRVMRGLANQLAYGAFNGDFSRPLFSNFMDGTNGWYRVGYAGRAGFGYAPFDLADSVPTGGYGFWSRFNGDIKRVTDAVRALILRAQAGDDDAAAFAQRYYAGLLDPGSRGMLMFLPSVANCRGS